MASEREGARAGVWEERWHPLREEWVIVAAHRQNRPWIGETVGRDGEAAMPAISARLLPLPGQRARQRRA